MRRMPIAQATLDELWDFSDAATSERRLRAAAAATADAEERAELDTQVARALGLQNRFHEALDLLDAIPAVSPTATVRTLLERGRVLNSAGDTAAAVPFFRSAAESAASRGLLFLQVDALHMLAIADAAGAASWTAEALSALGTTKDPRVLRWSVSLHNNAGWAAFDAGKWDEALSEFEAARDAAARWGTADQLQWADEAIAETRLAQSG